MTDRLRIGVLGTGTQALSGCIKPAASLGEKLQIVAIASRELERAAKLAAKHDIPRSYGGYEQLLADTDVDAVYIALPTSLHCRWAVAAMEVCGPVVLDQHMVGNESIFVLVVLLELCEARVFLPPPPKIALLWWRDLLFSLVG
jgi:D-arabinose 1-dehydrogenase-like Zn-dependent alcohol dehydrogenase